MMYFVFRARLTRSTQFSDNALVCISKTKNERLEIKVRLIEQ